MSADDCRACATVETYIRKMDWEGYDTSPFTIIKDPWARAAYEVNGVPTSIVLDKYDNEVDRKVGAPNFNGWLEWLKKNDVLIKIRSD